MNNFTFYSPTLFTFGDGEEKNTGALVRRFGGSRVLLVTGGGSVRRNGAYDAVTASLEAAGIPFTELSDVQANPRSGKVYEGIEICRRENVDFLLAVGGGSVIDTAKAIGFGVPYDGDFWDFFTGKAKIERTLPVGTVLAVGECELVVTQIGKKCHNDCEIHRLTGKCVMPTDGIFAVVTRGGVVRPGDAVRVGR